METYIQYAILRTLSYFQVFQYPLTSEEIWQYLSSQCDKAGVENALIDLEFLGVIFKIDDYYSLVDDTVLITRRIEGNLLGAIRLKKAMRIARFLGAFPFVEAVCISGSLSKDFALPGSDLDYFIITAPNRLWIARNIMHLFRKLTFLVGAQHSFCMNYYITVQSAEIIPRNLYTAIELASLKPAYTHSGIEEIVTANNHWVTDYLPHCDFSQKTNAPKSKKWLPTRLFERVIDKMNGNRIEKIVHKTTMKRWAKRWNKQGYDVAQCMLSAGADFNTPVNYPVHFPERILRDHASIFRDILFRYNRSIWALTSTTRASYYE